MTDAAIELLNSMEEEAALYSDEPSYLEIDSELRTISVPSSLANIGVYSDDSVKRLYFKMPKTYEENDLSTFNISINYLNARGSGDRYLVEDAKVEGDFITFSWLIGRNAYAREGNVVFNVCLRKYGDDGYTIVKEWNTTTSVVTVLSGLEADSSVVTPYTDIVDQLIFNWNTEFNAAKTNAEKATANALEAANKAEVAANLPTENTKDCWGVRFESTTGSNTDGVVRLYSAASMGKPTFATLEQQGSYPFDDAGPWKFTEFLIKFNEDGTWYPFAFKRMDGTMSPDYDANKNDYDHMVRFKNAYFYRNDDAGTYIVSTSPRNGFSPFKVNMDGSVPEYIWIPVYKMGQSLGPVGANTGVGYSRPGHHPYWNNFQNHGKVAKNASVRATLGSSWFENWKQVMTFIELGSRDVQNATDVNGAKLPGFSFGIYDQNTCKVAEAATNVNTVKVTKANAFVVGQTVNICTGWISTDKVSYRTVEEIDATANTLTLSGDPFNVEAGWSVYNVSYKSGQCDDILGHTGAKVLSNGRYGMKYRGIENLWGETYEDVCDLRLTLVDPSNTSSNYNVKYCNDLLHARDVGDTPDVKFVDTGLVIPQSGGWIKKYKNADQYPEVAVPAGVGASGTTWFSDYIWFYAADNRAVRSGGDWSSGSGVGVSARHCLGAASASYRRCCARLFLEP